MSAKQRFSGGIECWVHDTSVASGSHDYDNGECPICSGDGYTLPAGRCMSWRLTLRVTVT